MRKSISTIENFDQFIMATKSRDYYENRAMMVLSGRLHLVGKDGQLLSKEEQNKKDLFLYKYYEYQYNFINSLILSYENKARSNRKKAKVKSLLLGVNGLNSKDKLG